MLRNALARTSLPPIRYLTPSPFRLAAFHQPFTSQHRRLPRASRLHCLAVAEPPLKMGGKRGARSSRSSGSSKSSKTVLTPLEQHQQHGNHVESRHTEPQHAQHPADGPQHHAATDARSLRPSASTASTSTSASTGSGLLPIAFSDGAVTVGDGLVLLDRITPQARVQHPASAHTDLVVLSMAATSGPTAMEDFSLGVLHCQRWLCCARNKLWWMTPEWGKTARELPPETQFLLAELEDGSYACILPLISQQKFRGTLRPPRKGTMDHAYAVLQLRMESGSDTVMTDYFDDAVLLAAGRDPYTLLDAAVAAAARLSGGARPLSDKQLPPNLDVFGWCSWDSFYSAVSASGLSDAVQSLSSGGTPPRWVVIDDGWQCTEVDEPYRNIPTEQLKQRVLREKAEKPGDAALREAYLEGEMEALGQAAREIPAGTAMGAYLQEIRASGPPQDDLGLSGVDYHSLARQHSVGGGEESGLVPTKRHPLVLRAASTAFQYLVGLLVGAFQAVVVLFYQWVVDPAEHGTWPVRFFTYLTTGPLKGSMLQFFADSTNFTRRLTDVRANAKFSSPYATPEDVSSGRREDLKSVVENLRKRYGVQYVYCWHGLSAYWSGVSPTAPAMAKYEPSLHFPKPTPGLSEIEPSTAWNPGILGGISVAQRVDALFSDMHAYLADAGVSGVKVDCQAGVGLVGSSIGGGPAAAATAHRALEDSIAAHFADNHAINCMCHSTENIYRWRDTAVARASDDFYPTDRASHIPHLAACAFNGLFLSPLALPDWDMFSSRHVAADIHAAARAVSGGPVYVSDAPGSHSFDLLRRLVLPDGTVLRAALPGRPTRDSLLRDVMRDGTSLLKVWNMNSVGGVVGVFNLQGASWDRSRRRFHIHQSSPPQLEALVRPTDVEVFRQQLEAAGCDVAGALAAAAAKGAAAASRAARRAHSSPKQADGHSARVPLVSAMPDPGSGSHSGSMDASSSFDDSAGSTANGASAASSAASSSSALHGASFAPAGPRTAAGSGQPPAQLPLTSGEDDGEEGRVAPSPPDFAAYVDSTRELHRLRWDQGVPVSLEGWTATVVTIVPIARHEFGGSSSAGLEFAPIGLTNMLNSGGAVCEVHVERVGPSSSTFETLDLPLDGEAPEQLLVHLALRGRGTLLAYSSHRPKACFVDGFEVQFEHQGDRLTVQVPQVGSLHAGRSEQRLVVAY